MKDSILNFINNPPKYRKYKIGFIILFVLGCIGNLIPDEPKQPSIEKGLAEIKDQGKYIYGRKRFSDAWTDENRMIVRLHSSGFLSPSALAEADCKLTRDVVGQREVTIIYSPENATGTDFHCP